MALEADEVLIAVPLALAEQVLRMKGDFRRGSAPATTRQETAIDGPTPPPRSFQAPDPGYTKEEIARLKGKIQEQGYRGVLALFDLCAERDDWVLKAEADTAAGMTAIHLRNQLRSLSWLVKQLFGDRRWPIEAQRWGGLFYYRLHPKVAGWWRAA